MGSVFTQRKPGLKEGSSNMEKSLLLFIVFLMSLLKTVNVRRAE